ncbi:MAG TPA: VCBS repeat-containing protein [Polyangiaceae bacterium]|nr:VCBS repeat-containing protein [Polyangiaceae bacterium]
MRERHVALIALLGASLSGCAADTLPLQGEIEATGGSGSVSSTDTPGSDTTGGGATAPTSGLLNVHEIAGTGVWGGDAAFVGDLDHDGFADLAILDHTVRPPLLLPSLGAYGAVYGFYGRARFPAQIDTTAADFVLLGATTGIGALGDVDGDGFDDFGFVSNCAVACDSTTGVHIVFGGAERLAGVHLSNTVGITWQVPSGWSPVSAQGAGDVNGDGLPDIVIDTNWPQTALLFGRTDRDELAHAMPDATFDMDPNGLAPGVGSIGAGDLDGDGYGDLLVPSGYPPGYPTSSGNFLSPATLLYYGGAERFHGSLTTADADAAFTFASRSQKPAHDLDGDGYDDLELPAFATPSQDASIRVFYGQSSRFSGSIQQGDAPFTLTMSDPSLNGAGVHGTGTGDIDGDGYVDLVSTYVAGTDGQVPQPGALALLRGTPSRQVGAHAYDASDVILSGEDVGPDGFGFGTGVTTGDFNGDGIDDVVVTSNGQDLTATGHGYAFLIFDSRR